MIHSLRVLKVKGIGSQQALGSGYIAADASRAVISGTGLAVAELQAMGLVGVGNSAHEVMHRMGSLCLVDGTVGGIGGHMAVVLVAHGEHEMRQNRQFQQSEPPVFLVLLGMQVLGLTAQGHLAGQLVIAFEHKDVALYSLRSVTFNQVLVVALVGVHQVHLEAPGELLLYQQVDVLEIDFGTHLEEARLGGIVAHLVLVGGIGLLLNASDMREVELDIRTVLAA